jgi:hypothetical protein
METQTSGNNQRNGNEAKSTMERPVRRNFRREVVIASNGSVVPEADWRAKIGDVTEPRAIRKALKNAGMQQVRVFDAEAYTKARADFKQSQKDAVVNERKSIVAEAFEEAGQGHNARVEAILKTLLPLYREIPSKKTIQAFKTIIRTVASTASEYEPKPKSATRRGRKPAAAPAQQAQDTVH